MDTSGRIERLVTAAALTGLSVLAPAVVSAQPSIAGEWTGQYHEDQSDRVPGDVVGDATGVPISQAALRYAQAWDVTRVSVLEEQCQPYNVAHIFRGPLQFRIWEETEPGSQKLVAYHVYIGTYMQDRTIWMDGREHPPEYSPHTHMGFSTGVWNGDILTVQTTHIKKEFYRRSGLPSSDETTMTEYFIPHENILSQVTIVDDPVYLTEPWIQSQEFVKMERGNQNWLYNCEYVMEVPGDKNEVPHFLPGANPFMADFARKFGLPFEAVWAGAEATYPEYQATLRKMMASQ